MILAKKLRMLFEKLEIFAVVLSIIYVVLASKENYNCWYFGLASASIYALICFQSKLYAETILQIFYVIASLYGLFLWKKSPIKKKLNKPQKNSTLFISDLSIKNHFLLIGLGSLIFVFFGIFLAKYTDAELPFVDAFTTIFSLFATYLTTKKILSNWLYWIVIDMTSVFLYHQRELHLTAFLFIIYTTIAIYGYFSWRKKMSDV